MVRFILTRFVGLVFVLLMLSVITFGFMYGGPWRQGEHLMPDEQLAALKARYIARQRDRNPACRVCTHGASQRAKRKCHHQPSRDAQRAHSHVDGLRPYCTRFNYRLYLY